MKMRKDSNGVHFFDRTSGLNVLLEGDGSGTFEAVAPRYVSVALTNACELRCSYCYAPKGSGRLDRATLQCWLTELDDNGCLGVGFGGGEPTLYTDFGALCSWVACETSLAVGFTTHGHNLSEDLCRALRGHVHFVRVSMDGVGATYEALRGRRFRDLLQALQRVADLAPFGLNVVVNEFTIDDLDRVADLATDLGAAELLLLLEQPTKRSGGASPHTRERMNEWIWSRPATPRIAISSQSADPSVPTAQPFAADTSPLDGYVHIDAYGVMKDSSFDRSGVRLGKSAMEGVRSLRSAKAGNR